MSKLILVLVLFTLSTAGFGQADSYPTPEFSRQPYYFDPLSKHLMPLEKAIGRMKNKIGLMGGGSMVYVIEEPTSRVTLVAANRSEFVVTDLASGFMEPSTIMPLYRIRSGKRNREWSMTNGGGKMNESDKIEYELKKSGEKYIFVLLHPLPPGEYAFISLMSAGHGQTMTAYCFRVQ